MKLLASLFCVCVLLCFQATSWAEETVWAGLKWREVGPYRGGRVAAVTGLSQDPNTYYFGATGGGVWKTTDGGGHWKNISDGYFGGSIGAVAVSEWDPNVVYVGGGEKTVRGNVSHGDGIWRSTDAGRRWQSMGLTDSRHITRIRIHPKNPNLVYVAAMGHLFGPNEQRGVFRSQDGGAHWEKILYINDEVGIVDLAMDPTNPRVLYASSWRVIRRPYSLESGGEGSGLWVSHDGGEHWSELTGNTGLPPQPWGISGITVSPSNPDNLYAIIEAEQGGVFRSKDGGKSWQRVNQERQLRQRAWYYSRIYADPADEEGVYVLNVRFHHSRDGGKSFRRIRTPHGDNHDLWIDPADPLRMIESNDGGAQISRDGGASWTAQSNQPTAQMYRVSVDNAFPYRLLGGQQDNTALRIRSRSARGRAIGLADWEATAGGESGHVVAKPDAPDVVFGGSYGGYLIRLDHHSGDVRAVNIWPDDPMGWGAAELSYRFNWNFPLLFSPHDPDTLYAGANVLFKTTNDGESWQAISPDLTRNLKEKQGPSGGPITKDNTSVEYYGTLFALAESPVKAGVLWTGSDDGLVQLSRDGGENWLDVTPKALPEEIQINALEPHPSVAGGLYLAATAYKSDDFRPYLFKTTDYGKHWTRIDAGIDQQHFTRVIRADPKQPGLLFAGTERGIYLSHDDGEHWRPMPLNLPIVPVTDLAVKGDDLIAATQGRGYWILDDLSVLRQSEMVNSEAKLHLFTPSIAWRLDQGRIENPEHMGQNPPAGVRIRYWMKQALGEEDHLSLRIYTAKDRLVREYQAKREMKLGEKKSAQQWGDDPQQLPGAAGLNEFVWDLSYPSAERFKGLVLWNDDLDGPRAVPGLYRLELTLNDQVMSTAMDLQGDPRRQISVDEYQEQFEFVDAMTGLLNETHRSIRDLRQLRSQLQRVQKQLADKAQYAELHAQGKLLIDAMKEIEEALYQTQLESPQDPLNFPIRLNDKLAGLKSLAAYGDHAPTQAMLQVRDILGSQIRQQLEAWRELKEHKISAYNTLASQLAVPLLDVQEEDSGTTNRADDNDV